MNRKSVILSICLMSLTFVPIRGQRVDTLKTIYITAVKEKMKNTTQTGLTRLDAKKIRSAHAVLGTPDVIKTLQTLPGVASGSELSSGLYVHGGDGNDNLFLLDGVPLYNVSHFGGLFSSFNTDVLESLDFYKSGFPARYGGRLSSVVDVETAEGDMREYHGKVSLGLIDGRIQVEGPVVKDRTSFNFGIRRSWLDLVAVPAIAYANRKRNDGSTVDGSYSMMDINARLTHRFSPASRLNLNFYWGDDRLRAGIERNTSGSADLDIDVKWGSLLGSVCWDYDFSKQLRSRMTAYYTRSHSNTGYAFALGNSSAASGRQSMRDNDISHIGDAGLTYDFHWYPNSSNHVRYGLAGIWHMYNSSRNFHQDTVTAGDTSSSDGIEELSYNALESAVYIEDEWFITWNLTLNAGARFALFCNRGGGIWPSLEPRAAVKWLISRDICAKLSYTRMIQYSHLVSAMYMDLPTNSWMPSTADAAPMKSDQVAGGLYFTPGKFRFNIEGWYKTIDGMLAYNGANAFYPPLTNWEHSFTSGKGKSYGLEVEAGWGNDFLDFTAYYTLSRSLRFFEDYHSEWFPDRNDNLHKVNLLASWKFARGWELSFNWNYHSGNRITIPTHVLENSGSIQYLYDSPYNGKLPDYHRLDMGLSYHLEPRDASGDRNGKGHSWDFVLSVYNVYNRLNASFAMVQKERDGSFSGMAYGLVPIIPTFSVSFNF